MSISPSSYSKMEPVWTLVHAIANEKDDQVELAELLLEHGASVDALFELYEQYLDIQGTSSILGLAIKCDNPDMVALLLRFGANTADVLFRDVAPSALLFGNLPLCLQGGSQRPSKCQP